MIQQWADYLWRLKEGVVTELVRALPATDAQTGSNWNTRGGRETTEPSVQRVA